MRVQHQLRLTPLRGSEEVAEFGAMLASAHFGDEIRPRELLEQTRSFLEAHPREDPWGSYLVWDESTAIGICAYKSAPDANGAVEIAYGTFPAYEGRGYAKAMIALLFELAVSSGAAKVFAHTFAKENTSSSALQRQGFRFVGKFMDHDDGLVCRWEKQA